MVSATKLLVAAQPDSSGVAARQNAATAMDLATGVKVDLLLVDLRGRFEPHRHVREQRQNRQRRLTLWHRQSPQPYAATA